MNSLPHRPVNRRGFLVAWARSAALVVLAAFAWWQDAKRRRLANDPDCIKLSACTDCLEFGRCTKPKAQAARGPSRTSDSGQSPEATPQHRGAG